MSDTTEGCIDSELIGAIFGAKSDSLANSLPIANAKHHVIKQSTEKWTFEGPEV